MKNPNKFDELLSEWTHPKDMRRDEKRQIDPWVVIIQKASANGATTPNMMCVDRTRYPIVSYLHKKDPWIWWHQLHLDTMMMMMCLFSHHIIMQRCLSSRHGHDIVCKLLTNLQWRTERITRSLPLYIDTSPPIPHDSTRSYWIRCW